jgi:hypothetical protein
VAELTSIFDEKANVANSNLQNLLILKINIHRAIIIIIILFDLNLGEVLEFPND